MILPVSPTADLPNNYPLCLRSIHESEKSLTTIYLHEVKDKQMLRAIQPIDFTTYHNGNIRNISLICVKPGLHESQLPVERSVTLVSSIVVERRRCALQISVA